MRQSPLLIAILAALSGCNNTEAGKACMQVPEEQTTCPAGSAVDPNALFTPDRCGWDVVEVTSDGVRETLQTQVDSQLPACCYRAELVEEEPGCVIGRPYFDGSSELRAPLVSRAGTVPDIESPRAAAWAEAGSGEHASVAAFARLSLQLMRFGAPSDLLRDVHQAAMDEVRHAEICWALAARFGAAPVSAGAFPFPESIAVDADLPALAAAAVREGCLAETLGAHVVSVAAELAPEPDVKAALTSIAREEALHAVLSFRIVAWALRAGGAEVRVAVHAALARPWPALNVDELALRANVDVAQLRSASQKGLTEVIRPAAAELFAA